jgi:DNA helicase II / ATP-dependent DNA helicase PcrA
VILKSIAKAFYLCTMSLQREKLLQKFSSEYNRLNEQQRKAVDQTEGPVMVIAGPGTGKTQILSARIGKILLGEGGVEPQNILCLTYTDAGVVAMRKRLVQFIGPDAYKVHLYTFHAFCNDVIQENLALFEKTALDPISDLERIELMKELIDGFGKDHPLKRYRGDVYFEIHSLQALFSMMKRESWKADYICQKVDEYLNDLPLRDEYICKRATKEFKKGDVRWDKIEEQREKMEKLRAACSEFQRYQQKMRERSRYDFDDMINWVIEAFQNNEELLRRYQEQFQYILVDEYQDTSGSQNRIVELLISFWEKPNVFVVGDDDQSIYRFQGANVENMLQFAQSYAQDLLTIVLTNNYRSTQPILDISKTLIDRNDERLVKQIDGLSKDLRCSHDGLLNLIDSPIIREYETGRDEMIHITLEIEKLINQGVPGNAIGVIYRENKWGEELADYLRLKGLPFYTKRNLNILDQPFIKQLLLVLNYLRAEHDLSYSGDEMLFEILHFEWWGIQPIEIAKASMQVSELKYKGRSTSLRQYLTEKISEKPTDLFWQPLPKEIMEAITVLESLVAAVSNCTLQGLVEKVLREGQFLTHTMNHSEKGWLLRLLTGFFDHVKEETRRHPQIELEGFMSRMDLMRREGLVLPLVQVAGNDKGVNLMTAHGSKGLEFEYVFFSGCNSGCWEKKRKPFSGFSFPDTLFTSAGTGAESEELRRLFYVALTRAKRHLFISYPHYNTDGKQLEPSVFIAEVLEQHILPTEKIFLSPEVTTDFQILQLSAPQAPEVAHLEDEWEARAVGAFQMNVSALNNYLRCPLQFYYQNVVRIPTPRNEAMEFGSAVHHALEALFRKRSERERFPSADEFVQDFVWYMKRHRESFTKEEFARRMEYGQTILRQYFVANEGRWNPIAIIERNIRGVVIDEIPLKGKLDKIEFRGKEATIVDYKSGDPEKAKEKLQPPSPKNPTGGDYWRQAVFYKLLVDNYASKDWQVGNVVFDFIEPDKKKEYRQEKVVVTDADTATVKEQVRTVWEKIQRHDFYTGCGKDDCHWCGFVKTNKLAIALHDIVEEEAEDERGGNILRVV